MMSSRNPAAVVREMIVTTSGEISPAREEQLSRMEKYCDQMVATDVQHPWRAKHQMVTKEEIEWTAAREREGRYRPH
jgi:hypothetical protein